MLSGYQQAPQQAPWLEMGAWQGTCRAQEGVAPPRVRAYPPSIGRHHMGRGCAGVENHAEDARDWRAGSRHTQNAVAGPQNRPSPY